MADGINANRVQLSSSITVTADMGKHWANKAQEWAISGAIVDNTDYSAKYYANKAKDSVDEATTKLNTVSNNITYFENNINSEIEKVETVVNDNIEIIEASVSEAKDWANKLDDTVDGEEYSAKYYAQQASETVGQAIADIETAETTALNEITAGRQEIASDLSAAQSVIETAKQEALDNVNSAETSALNNINSAETTALNDIETARQEAIEDITGDINLEDYYSKSETARLLAQKANVFNVNSPIANSVDTINAVANGTYKDGIYTATVASTTNKYWSNSFSVSDISTYAFRIIKKGSSYDSYITMPFQFPVGNTYSDVFYGPWLLGYNNNSVPSAIYYPIFGYAAKVNSNAAYSTLVEVYGLICNPDGYDTEPANLINVAQSDDTNKFIASINIRANANSSSYVKGTFDYTDTTYWRIRVSEMKVGGTVYLQYKTAKENANWVTVKKTITQDILDGLQRVNIAFYPVKNITITEGTTYDIAPIYAEDLETELYRNVDSEGVITSKLSLNVSSAEDNILTVDNTGLYAPDTSANKQDKISGTHSGMYWYDNKMYLALQNTDGLINLSVAETDPTASSPEMSTLNVNVDPLREQLNIKNTDGLLNITTTSGGYDEEYNEISGACQIDVNTDKLKETLGLKKTNMETDGDDLKSSGYNVFSINTGDVDENGLPTFLNVDEAQTILTTSGTFTATTASGVSYQISDVITCDISMCTAGTWNIWLDPVAKELSVDEANFSIGKAFPEDVTEGDYLFNTAQLPYKLQIYSSEGITTSNRILCGTIDIKAVDE